MGRIVRNFAVESHDKLIHEIIRYARVPNIPRDAQKSLLEAALEYLAVTRVLPEQNITQWPEGGLVGGFRAHLREAAN